MKNSWSRPDVTILWGAGASIDAGIEPYGNWRFYTNSASYPLLNRVWTQNSHIATLEDLWDAIVQPETRTIKPVVDDGHGINVAELWDETKRFIADRLRPGKIPESYREFARQLHTLSTECSQRVYVISTNWDCLLEAALAAEGEFLDLAMQEHQGAGTSQFPIRVAKVHGSIGVALNRLGYESGGIRIEQRHNAGGQVTERTSSGVSWSTRPFLARTSRPIQIGGQVKK